ncbi:MAG TPA: family 20 glycosylhydrolase [Capsulimonadaceae bacterium]|jgi:hypothetical protein
MKINPHFSAALPDPGLPWRIRAVQLDLARQFETVEFVKRFIDDAARWGFNTVVLYLEGRVRTASFPYPLPESSYSVADMSDIVRHAASAGVDIIPVVPTLGHCELFVNYPDLAHLAEERSGRSRFGEARRSTLCPSLDETYEFLRLYLTELAAVFTGPYLHIGCDEAWSLGFCDKCEPRRIADGLGSLFVEHVDRVASIARDLGKRPMIWDDMFEWFPERLTDIPRDVVMCHWSYNPSIQPEGALAHFSNLWRHDCLAEYERLGFDSLVCPWVIYTQNIVSITDYGRHHRVLGGLLTQWEEKSCRFHDDAAPVVAFTGKLWSGETFDVNAAWDAALPEFASGDAGLRTAIRLLSNITRPQPPSSVQAYLTGAISVHEFNQASAICSGIEMLDAMKAGAVNDRARMVVGDMLEWSHISLLKYTLRELIPAAYTPRRQPADLPQLRSLLADARQTVDECVVAREARWSAARPGIAPNAAVADLRAMRILLDQVAVQLTHEPGSNDWWLVLRLFLPDDHGRPHIKVTVDGTTTVIEGCFKPDSTSDGVGPYYTVQVPFISESKPQTAEIEAWGYGGQGIAFMEVQNRDTTLMPQAVLATAGQVSIPEALLRDDSLWAFLGERGYDLTVHEPERAAARSSVTVRLDHVFV